MKSNFPNENEKESVISRLLGEEYFLAHLNPASEGLIIPDHLKNKDTVTLKLSRLFRGGIELKQGKILTTLLFEQKYVDCCIPLESIWGVTGHDGSNMIWPESTPKSILKTLLQPAEEATPPKSESTKRTGLRRVK